MFYGQCWKCGERWGLGTASTCKCPEELPAYTFKPPSEPVFAQNGDTLEIETILYTSPQPAQQDIPDLIAGALGVSRGTAYDMMREALAEQSAQQEPVAWMHEWEDGERIPMLTGRDDRNNDEPISVHPLVYADTSPPPASKLLTDEQWQIIADTLGCLITRSQKEIIEAALGIKENT